MKTGMRLPEGTGGKSQEITSLLAISEDIQRVSETRRPRKVRYALFSVPRTESLKLRWSSSCLLKKVRGEVPNAKSFLELLETRRSRQ